MERNYVINSALTRSFLGKGSMTSHFPRHLSTRSFLSVELFACARASAGASLGPRPRRNAVRPSNQLQPRHRGRSLAEFEMGGGLFAPRVRRPDLCDRSVGVPSRLRSAK